MEKIQTPKGFRDFLPKQMKLRNFVVSKLRKTFEKYGFEPLETPALEYASVLLGKYGEEADRLIYTFEDRGGRKVGLNYDLTVPTARVLATYQNEIKLPFKRYQIQRAYRAENTQKGRYREFVQCDVDTFGSSSPLADAEILAVVYEGLLSLGFPSTDIKIKVNSREILSEILTQASITDEKTKFTVLQSIDKLDKSSWENVTLELSKKGLETNQISKLRELIESKKLVKENILSQVIDLAVKLGVSENSLVFDPSLARGLDYYTGAIFEATIGSTNLSVVGGGRYDNLIESLGGPNIPAVGVAFGLDRICDILDQSGTVKALETSSTKALVCLAETSEAVLDYAVDALSELRKNSINAEIYLEAKNLDKQLKYASEREISYALVIGSQELSDKTISLKNLKTREQEVLSIDEVVERLRV